MSKNSVRVRSAACPSCGKVLDAASAVFSKERIEPRPGDISICIGCAAANQFAEDLTLVSCRLEDVPGMNPEDIAKIRKLQRLMCAKKPN